MARSEQRLTDRYVGSLRCPDKRNSIVFRDPVSAGLTLYVSKTGVKTWRYAYRFMGGNPQAITLGQWPALKAAKARQMAENYERNKRLGFDPMRKSEKVRLKQDKPATVKAVLDYHVSELENPDNRRRVEAAFRPLIRHVNAYGSTTVNDFDAAVFKDFIECWLDGRPGAAKFLIRNVTAAFNRAQRPASGLAFPPGFRNPGSGLGQDIKFIREHVVTSHAEGWEEEKYKAFFRGIEKAKRDPRLGFHGRAIIELLALTGARPSEICSLRLDEIDGDVVLKQKHKTLRKGGLRKIMLTEMALEVIDGVKRHNKAAGYEGPWLFPQRRVQKNQKVPYVTSTNQFAAIVAEHAGIQFTPYTLRGAYISFMLDLLGFEYLDAVAANVGHKDPSVTLKHYRRHKESRLREVAKRGNDALRALRVA